MVSGTAFKQFFPETSAEVLPGVSSGELSEITLGGFYNFSMYFPNFSSQFLEIFPTGLSGVCSQISTGFFLRIFLREFVPRYSEGYTRRNSEKNSWKFQQKLRDRDNFPYGFRMEQSRENFQNILLEGSLQKKSCKQLLLRSWKTLRKVLWEELYEKRYQ